MPLLFENDGELDVTAMTTFGVNVKENSSAVGYFGTGLKYAIAIILRLGGEILINSGDRSFVFQAIDKNVRGKNFSVVGYTEYNKAILVEDKELAFTTELGKNWKPWQALREIYCNCADEKGSVKYIDDDLFKTHFDSDFMNFITVAKSGKTQVFVKCRELEEAYHNRDNYFLMANHVMDLGLVRLHSKEKSTRVYYRNILAHEQERPYAWTWNISRPMVLTEDRTLAQTWVAESSIITSVFNSKNQDLIEQFLSLPKGCAELSIVLPNSFIDDEALDIAYKAMLSTWKAHGTNWHSSVSDLFFDLKKKRADSSLTEFEPTAVQSQALQNAIDFLLKLDVPVTRYPITLTDDLPPSILGLAQNRRIYISTTALNMGTKQIAGTLYEEFLHLHNGFEDESRQFQNYLIDQVMTMGERLLGKPL